MRLLALACFVVRSLDAQTFAPPEVLELALPAAKFARDGALWAGDLDGDRKPDLLISAQGAGLLGGTRIHALRSRQAKPPHVLGAPAILYAGSVPVSTTEGCKARLTPRCCDLDGDGHLDLVVASTGMDLPDDAFQLPARVLPAGRLPRRPVRWFRGLADGGFGSAEGVRSTNGRNLLVPADVEKDVTKAQVEAGGAAGFGRLIAVLEAFEPIEIVPVDFDGDGRVDLVTQSTDHLLLHLATPSGFTDGVAVSGDEGPLVVDYETTPWFADLDGDAVLDLLTVLPDQSIGLRRGKRVGGTIHFGSPTTLVARPLEDLTRSLAVADWDGDGRLDLLMTENSVETIAGRPLTAGEQSRLARASAALRPLELEQAAQAAQPPVLSAAALRARRAEREALAARMQPYRTLVTDLEQLSKPREERRLRVVFLRRRE